MFKKTITFEDFNGEKQTQDFYFHLSKAEILPLITEAEGMKSRLEKIIASKDGRAIIAELRYFIELSCGIRSEDGKRFLKTPEAKSELLDSPAFDELLMELATDAGASVDFFGQLLPEKMQKEMLEAAKKSSEAPDPFADAEDKRPAYIREHRQPTAVELRSMSPEELTQAWAHREQNPQ